MNEPYFDPKAAWLEVSTIADNILPMTEKPATSGIMERLGNWYCRHFHRGITRPVNRRYECSVCQRKFRTEW